MSIDLTSLPECLRALPLHLKIAQTCDQVSIDSRSVDGSRALFVALKGTREDGHNFVFDAEQKGARFALVHTSYKDSAKHKRLLTIPVANTLKALQALAQHHRRRCRAKIIAIAGSSGKTLCKDLLYHLLRTTFRCRCSSESHNSQIGVPLSILKIDPRDELAIIECGISRPGEMRILAEMVRPDHAILTNIDQAHRESLGDALEICLEKCQLLNAVGAKGWCLLPQRALDLLAQHKCGADLASHWKAWDLPKASAPFSDCGKYSKTDSLQLSLEVAMPTRLQFHAPLVQLGTAAASLAGAKTSIISNRLKSFRLEAYQLEMWRAFSGFTIINDLYCADVATLGKTLDWAQLFSRPGAKKILFFGGVKNRPVKKPSRALRQQTEKYGIDALLIGDPMSTLGQRSLLDICSELSTGDLLINRGAKKLNFESLARCLNVPLPPATLEVDLAAVARNLRLIRKQLPLNTTVLAMLKARAYGTDAEIMARFLTRCGISHFGLATVEEAIELRRSGVEGELIVLHAAASQWGLAAEYDLQVCVSGRLEIRGLAKCAAQKGKVLKVHLHLDTGMCRLGCRSAQLLGLAKLIEQNPHLHLEGVMTHFASADDPKQARFTQRQSARFKTALERLRAAKIKPRFSHIANSAAAVQPHAQPCNLVRLGLALFGLTPPELNPQLALQPALTLSAKIAHLHTIRRGQSVSYGRRYTAAQDHEKIAVLPLGYADGLQRHFTKASVSIRGKRAPLVGAICMDFTMFDVTHIPGVRNGDTARVFGGDGADDLTAHQLAREIGISTHELIAILGPRIQRLFAFDQKPVIA